MTFVDTNYFLRFFINDIEKQHLDAKALFLKGANSELQLVSSVVVFFEIYWVFTSFYSKSKPEVLEILNNVLKLNFIKFEHRDILQKSLELFKTSNIELEDCYNIVYAKSNKCMEFKTFDKKLLKHFN